MALRAVNDARNLPATAGTRGCTCRTRDSTGHHVRGTHAFRPLTAHRPGRIGIDRSKPRSACRMTTHQDSRSDQRARVRAQRLLAVAMAAVVAAVLTVAGTPSQASAAVAGAPQKWSSLMYHSLTPSPAY